MSDEKSNADKYFELVSNEAKLFHEIQVLKQNNNDLRTMLAQSVDEKIHLDRIREIREEKQHAVKSYQELAKDMLVVQDRYYALCELVIKAILEFQWVTNGIKLNENQHIRLGDTLCELHDALAEYEKMKSQAKDIIGAVK